MTTTDHRHERGQVIVLFAILLPVFLAMGAVVVGAGNWFVHGKHLQTKADAGALAGGGNWEFPCETATDGRIEAAALLYAGTTNPQVGGVPNANVKVRLNALDWYDDDENPGQGNYDNPSGSVCAAMSLDVKVTEDNSFPLASLIPLFPDIKRRARVELQQSPGGDGILPIAVRAPEPTSAAAVFYNEATGVVLKVKYLVKSTSISNLPGGLQGWTTTNPEELDSLVRLDPPARTTGVVMAISYRGACNTNLPPPIPPNPPNIATSVAPCFEDEVAPNTQINTFCNQGVPRVATCYYATGDPVQAVQSGLHFIRGVPSTSPANGPPGLEEAYLENLPGGCSYFTQGNASCTTRLHITLNLGTLNGEYPNPSPPPPGPITGRLRAGDVEVRYCKVTASSNNNNACGWGNDEELLAGDPDATGTVSFATSGSDDPTLAPRSGRNAFAIQIRLRNARNHDNAQCGATTFGNNCRYRYLASTVTTNDPTRDEIMAAPVQRAFRGTLLTAGSTLFLRLTRSGCPGGTVYQDNEAGMAPEASASCYVVDAGLKGGLALDVDEPSVLFTDGTSSNQVGGVACNPGGQGPVLKEAVKYGCEPVYEKHPFNYPSPYDPSACPDPNDLFDDPMMLPPWNNGSWPPLRCIDTRQTGTGSQLAQGLNWRLFDTDHPIFGSCPADAPGFVKGRNYWRRGTNMAGNMFGYNDNGLAPPETHFDPNDPRFVTIFVSIPEAFAYANDKTHPITGFITVYITGFGTLGNAINGISEDPCPGGTIPPDLDDCSGNQCNNYVLWGHIVKMAVSGPRGRPNGEQCDPRALDPCVPVLVE